MNGIKLFSFFQETGAKYEGEYVNDLKEGQGKYTYGNGDVYKGQWKAGKRHGKGAYTYKENGGWYVVFPVLNATSMTMIFVHDSAQRA